MKNGSLWGAIWGSLWVVVSVVDDDCRTNWYVVSNPLGFGETDTNATVGYLGAEGVVAPNTCGGIVGNRMDGNLASEEGRIVEAITLPFRRIVMVEVVGFGADSIDTHGSVVAASFVSYGARDGFEAFPFDAVVVENR